MPNEVRVMVAGVAMILAGIFAGFVLNEAGILDGRLIVGILLIGFVVFILGVVVIVRRHLF